MNTEPRRSIWVIDDDPAIRDSVETVLAAFGWPVESFASGHDFLARFDPPRAACVVTDVCMPDMNGLELQAAIARLCPKMPVIIMTGHADVPMAVAAMKAGATDFIEKPFRAEELAQSIRRAVETAPRNHQEKREEIENIRARYARLTPRERDVLGHLALGQPNKATAHALGISARTVEIHRARVMKKMEAGNIPALVRMLIAAGIETP